MAQRGIDVSYETIRMWTRKFGRLFAHNLRNSRAAPSARWHLDEMAVRIGGRRMYLWRAVDDEGEVLDMLVQKRRNRAAAFKLLRKLLKNQGIHPETIVTDGSASYPAAAGELGCKDRHRAGGLRDNNRAENSHISIRRERTQTAAVQIARLSPEISCYSCRHLQHIQRPTPSDQPLHTSPSEGQRDGNLGGGDGVRVTMADAGPFTAYPR